MKSLLALSTSPKDHASHTELSPFRAGLKVTAEMSVLGHLRITPKILRSMGADQLKSLYGLLATDISRVTQEQVRRSGLKT